MESKEIDRCEQEEDQKEEVEEEVEEEEEAVEEEARPPPRSMTTRGISVACTLQHYRRASACTTCIGPKQMGHRMPLQRAPFSSAPTKMQATQDTSSVRTVIPWTSCAATPRNV